LSGLVRPSARGDLAALEKACGLNLKMKSSGNYLGRLSITKRGSPVVRHYLYLAALRLIKSDPRIAAWFRTRAGYRGGHKLVANDAVMRKLIRALWHVARGAPFDSSKLIDERALPSEAGSSFLPTSHDVPALALRTYTLSRLVAAADGGGVLQLAQKRPQYRWRPPAE
jgi:hypothetical protein